MGHAQVIAQANADADPVGELAELASPLSAKALQDLVGAELYRTLSTRQRGDVARKVAIVRGWKAYRKAADIPHGRVETAMSRFLAAAENRFGRSISVARLRRWVRRYREGGAPGLVDHRGRRAGEVPLDADLFLRFCGLLNRGVSIPQAHSRVRARAYRDGKWWPSVRTLRERLREKRTTVTRGRRPRGKHAYLVKGLSKN